MAEHAIIALPLQIGSGIRMRVLEAWSRGCPVVATPTAARGLDVSTGEQLLLAENPDAFAAAILRLAGDKALRQRLNQAGRDYLAAHHRSDKIAYALTKVYTRAIPRELSD